MSLGSILSPKIDWNILPTFFSYPVVSRAVNTGKSSLTSCSPVDGSITGSYFALRPPPSLLLIAKEYMWSVVGTSCNVRALPLPTNLRNRNSFLVNVVKL